MRGIDEWLIGEDESMAAGVGEGLRQRWMMNATARLPVADGRDRALLLSGGCLRLPRDGRPIRPKPAVFGSRRPSCGERASSPPRLARPARAPKALLAVASSGATPVVGRTPEGMGRERERGSVWEGGITNLLDPSPRWIRVGRPRRRSEAVLGVLNLK